MKKPAIRDAKREEGKGVTTLKQDDPKAKITPVEARAEIPPSDPARATSPSAAPRNFTPLPAKEPVFGGSERISFKVTDGKIDFASIRQTNAERYREVLKACLNDPEARSWLGMEQLTPEQVEELFAPEQMGMVLDVLVKVELIFATSSTKLPSEECERFLGFSEREHAILDKQGARVVARYCPREWLARMDLWLFILSLVTITGIKFKRLNEHARAVHAAAKRAVDDADKHPGGTVPVAETAQPPMPETSPAPPNGTAPAVSDVDGAAL